MTKTRKSVTKRIKITKKGKLIRRKMGLGHFRAKKNADSIRRKEKSVSVNPIDVKMFKKYL